MNVWKSKIAIRIDLIAGLLKTDLYRSNAFRLWFTMYINNIGTLEYVSKYR